MRSLLLSMIGLALAACSSADGGPASLLVAWDPNPAGEQVTEYVVYVDNAEVARTGSTTTTVLVNPGTHTVQVAACNLWGCSLPSGPVSTPALPSTPGGLRIGV